MHIFFKQCLWNSPCIPPPPTGVSYGVDVEGAVVCTNVTFLKGI